MSWMSWQIDYLLLLQNFRHFTNDVLDNFFLFISQLGVMPFTVIAICVIYWGLNKKLGIYIIYCYCLSYLMNIILKFTFCIYRPWIIDTRVQPAAGAFVTAPGYSFPSGHTAGAVSFWGSIGVYFRDKKVISYFCLLIIFLVMLSRNYLGVHTSQDVIVSFIVGLIILFFTRKMLFWNEEKEGRDIYIIGVITIVCILLAVYLAFKSYPMDYKDGLLLYDPTEARLSAMARILNLFAIFLGSFLEMRFIKFNPKNGSIIRRIILVTVGVVIFLAMEFPIHKLLADYIEPQTAKCIIRFITGFFITFIYPCCIKLTDNLLSKNA